MIGLYRGKNRYHVAFEPLADFSTVESRQREAAVQAAIGRYAALDDAAKSGALARAGPHIGPLVR